MTMTTQFTDPELAKSAEATYRALQRVWAREKPVEQPARHRYAMTFDCTPDEFEAVRLALAGRDLGNKACRYVPPGWVPGMPL